MKKILVSIAVLIVLGVAGAHWYFSDRGRFTTEAVYTDLARSVSGTRNFQLKFSI